MNKTKNIILTGIFILICVAATVFFSMFTNDTDFSDIILREESMTFTSDAGETIEYDMSGGSENSDKRLFDMPRVDGVYTSVYFLEKSDEYLNMSLSFGLGQAEVYVDDELVYTGSIMQNEKLINIPSVKIDVYRQDAPVKITTRIRYKDLNMYIFPAIINTENEQNKLSRDAAIVNAVSIPAGMMGLSFIIIIGLFLLSISFSSPDFSLLFLAMGTGSYCVSLISSSNTGNISMFMAEYPIISDLLTCFSILSILLYIIINRKKNIFKYFWVIFSIFILLVIAVQILGVILNNVPKIAANMDYLAALIYSQEFINAARTVNVYLIVISVLASLIYYIKYISEQLVEKSVIEARKKTMVSGYNNIVNNIRRTAAIRHEWKNNLITLEILYKEKKFDEIGAYLEKQNIQVAENDKMYFTENFMFDVILNNAYVRAKEEDVYFESSVNVAKSVNINEEDLCSLLMNMFDNAFNACREIKGKEKYIRFSAVQKNSFLAISCVNSAPDIENKADENDIFHGWGLKNMQAICKKYNSELVINNTQGEFLIETALKIK